MNNPTVFNTFILMVQILAFFPHSPASGLSFPYETPPPNPQSNQFLAWVQMQLLLIRR